MRCANSRRADASHVSGSDCNRELVEGERHAPIRRLVGGQLVVASPEILDEAMPGDDHPGTGVLLESSHRSQPRLETAMVGLDPIVGVPLGAVPRRWEQLLQHDRVGRCLVGDDLDRLDLGRADGPLEAPVGRGSVTPRTDPLVNDLPELVDRSVDVPPSPATFT